MDGPLRPVRGRDAIKRSIIVKLKEIIDECPYIDPLNDLDLDKYTFTKDKNVFDLELHDVDSMISLAKTILLRRPESIDKEGVFYRLRKKRKVADLKPASNKANVISSREADERVAAYMGEIEQLVRNYRSLFECI